MRPTLREVDAPGFIEAIPSGGRHKPFRAGDPELQARRLRYPRTGAGLATVLGFVRIGRSEAAAQASLGQRPRTPDLTGQNPERVEHFLPPLQGLVILFGSDPGRCPGLAC